jgi:hypothetical protein
MSMKKQVFWLRDHSSDPALPPRHQSGSGSVVRFLQLDAGQWLREIFVPRHSGATARDLHPFPYSPLTVIRGTLSYLPQYVVAPFKELYI